MRLTRYTLIAIACFMLLSCASTKLSQELIGGKALFRAGDYHEAFHTLLPAAAAGRPEAQYAVGYMYYYGYGTPQDSESGMFWMQKSAEQNYQPAIKALNQIYLMREQKSHEEFTEMPPKQTSMNQVPQQNQQDPVLQSLHKESHNGDLYAAMRVEAPSDKGVAKNDDVPVLPPVKIVSVPQPKPEIAVAAAVPKATKQVALNEHLQQDFTLPLDDRENRNPVKPKPVHVAPVMQALSHQLIKQMVKNEDVPQKYTLQLFGSYQLDVVKRLQASLGLKTASHIMHFSRNGKPWYVLTYGKFASARDAAMMKKHLPVRLSEMQPWVRDVSGLRTV